MKKLLLQKGLVLALGLGLAQIENAHGASYIVNGNTGPWLYGGPLNSSFVYGVNDHAAPVVVSGLTAGSGVSVAYVSGLIFWGAESPVDANGTLAHPNFADPSNGNGAGPGYFTANPNATYIGELMGAFTDGSGQIVGLPFGIGNGPINFVVPSGATQLQMGVNDNAFGDNTGSWTIDVQVIPEPSALALFGIGMAGLAWMRTRKQLVAASEPLSCADLR